MAFDTALKLVLLGQDKSASRALKGVGTEAGRTQGKLGKMSKLGGAAMLGIAGAAVVAGKAALDFGGDSIKAFADADKAQKQLEDAYKRFPKAQNVSIEALRKYNQELQRKTGADADDIASSQATLAMFKLTGKQIKDTTPLLVDYAAKTGKSLPDSAKVVGKALLGNTRALKDLGIDYKSTGDKGKDFADISELLKEKVGGFADSLPEAEKKQKILEASFGDLQESVGEKLQPALIGLIDAGQGMMDWLEQNPELVEGVSTAFDGLGGMLRWFWNKALMPLVKFWIAGNAKVVETIGGILEATGRMTGNKDLENFGRGIGKAATATAAWADGLKEIPEGVAPKVDVDDAKLKAKTAAIDKKVAAMSKQAIKLRSEGDTKGADKIEARIAALKKKKHQIDVGVGFVKSGKQTSKVIRSTGGFMRIAMNASGHPSFPGGLSWVGDAGPELLDLPRGTRIFSNGQSRAIANRASDRGGSTGAVVNNYYIKGDTNPNAAARRIARAQTQLHGAYGPGYRPVRGR